MSAINQLYKRMIAAMGIEGLDIPMTAVKFFRNEDEIPDQVLEYEPESVSVTSCQANKQAYLGDAVLLTRNNIGCIAAAISFGLVDENEDRPLEGSRVYTDIMKGQADLDENFRAPTPKDFTDGIVYACSESGRTDFCLFGKNDAGRFKSREIAKMAIKDMMAIQPPVMKGVFFYSREFKDINLLPDVIVFSVRPVELIRLVQAYQYNTGKRVTGSMGSVRVVNSDLIVRPYLTQEINFSSYCIGARLIAEYEPDRLGIGMPFSIFKDMVQGMEDSSTGYPFHLYPGAAQGKK
ncbi:MAG: DUF169 domain-containing protein [bacterium]|nr:DUF169 domain-containing protein [bacterium]